MKRAVIRLFISAHELKGNELREVVPIQEMEANGIQMNQIIQIDGEDTFHLLKKVREWLSKVNE